jgi:hypothetical protein
MALGIPIILGEFPTGIKGGLGNSQLVLEMALGIPIILGEFPTGVEDGLENSYSVWGIPRRGLRRPWELLGHQLFVSIYMPASKVTVTQASHGL